MRGLLHVIQANLPLVLFLTACFIVTLYIQVSGL